MSQNGLPPQEGSSRERVPQKKLVTTTIVPEEPVNSPKEISWRSWLVGLVWDLPDGDTKNRRYVRKLDAFLFSYICVAYFIKYLDQQNYSNAYVSGMKEDLGLSGNDRNWLGTYFNLGIIVGSIPSQLIQMKYVRSSIWIPFCEISWSVLVMAMAAAKNVQTLYVLRFFVGVFEACSFPGYSALLGGWYGPRELSKRVAIFEQSSSIASMFSGYIQAGLYKSMNGARGLAGWRWLFIIDGVISIPVALAGLCMIPDLPHTTRAFYWSKAEKEYGVERIEKIGRSAPRPFTLKGFWAAMTNWRLWAFLLPYVMVAEASTSTSYFNLWLQDIGYSVYDVNVLPTAGNALSIVVSVILGIVADRTGQRMLILIIIEGIVLVANILLSVWHIPNSAIMAANYLAYFGAAAQPIIIAWGYQLNGGDPNLFPLLVATGNIFTYTFSSFLPLYLFPTGDAPHYKYGYQILVMFGLVSIIGAFILRYQEKMLK
ncbi:hypothetical protein N7495_000146 [Penicillium taxi]|uniref:uncharacterized protein n=1 Tax=Penicillium taxi TaxID=168475 RepID=UPI0025454864|nr:uncharacterized protein N7495_000146 [Penicillium taxi]KAJ5907464.1 hypothetical protein N7495_000146 [Penicillium taxi]